MAIVWSWLFFFAILPPPQSVNALTLLPLLLFRSASEKLQAAFIPREKQGLTSQTVPDRNCYPYPLIFQLRSLKLEAQASSCQNLTGAPFPGSPTNEYYYFHLKMHIVLEFNIKYVYVKLIFVSKYDSLVVSGTVRSCGVSLFSLPCHGYSGQRKRENHTPITRLQTFKWNVTINQHNFSIILEFNFGCIYQNRRHTQCPANPPMLVIIGYQHFSI